MTNEEWIQFQSISKRFNKQGQVGKIDLALRKGEIFALCGGNGAGKSTFIKVVTGIMKETTGKIIVNGVPVKANNKKYKSLFSYMPDHMLFPNQLTGQEALMFFAKLRKIDMTRVEQMLELVGLHDVKDRLIKHYSKGMQQRLSFAQALLPETSFMILDEPTNGLDPYWFYRMKEILKEEKQKGKTILFTTHVLSLVEEIADRVAFMENGKIISNGKVETLLFNEGGKRTLEQIFFDKQRSERERGLAKHV